jgi:DNA-binding response OmpR family regulator
MRILIVEDSRQIMETLCDFLELKGHSVDCAWHGEAAIELLKNQHFDVIIMDIMMPKLNGIETVAHLRQKRHLNTPVLFLTARDQLEDKVAAFEAGGDDYLVKPFAMRELILRLEALSKRGRQLENKQLVVGDLTLDIALREVRREGVVLKLSKIQFHLLSLLMQQYPSVVTKQHIFATIWHGDAPDSDALRSHIYALRNVLDKGFNFNMLETIHGQGYRLVTSK